MSSAPAPTSDPSGTETFSASARGGPTSRGSSSGGGGRCAGCSPVEAASISFFTPVSLGSGPRPAAIGGGRGVGRGAIVCPAASSTPAGIGSGKGGRGVTGASRGYEEGDACCCGRGAVGSGSTCARGTGWAGRWKAPAGGCAGKGARAAPFVGLGWAGGGLTASSGAVSVGLGAAPFSAFEAGCAPTVVTASASKSAGWVGRSSTSASAITSASPGMLSMVSRPLTSVLTICFVSVCSATRTTGGGRGDGAAAPVRARARAGMSAGTTGGFPAGAGTVGAPAGTSSAASEALTGLGGLMRTGFVGSTIPGIPTPESVMGWELGAFSAGDDTCGFVGSAAGSGRAGWGGGCGGGAVDGFSLEATSSCASSRARAVGRGGGGGRDLPAAGGAGAWPPGRGTGGGEGPSPAFCGGLSAPASPGLGASADTAATLFASDSALARILASRSVAVASAAAAAAAASSLGRARRGIVSSSSDWVIVAHCASTSVAVFFRSGFGLGFGGGGLFPATGGGAGTAAGMRGAAGTTTIASGTGAPKGGACVWCGRPPRSPAAGTSTGTLASMITGGFGGARPCKVPVRRGLKLGSGAFGFRRRGRRRPLRSGREGRAGQLRQRRRRRPLLHPLAPDERLWGQHAVRQRGPELVGPDEPLDPLFVRPPPQVARQDCVLFAPGTERWRA